MSALTLRNYILFATSIFVIISKRALVDASFCEVIYRDHKGDVLCTTTYESINRLKESFLVLKSKCSGSEVVYQNCPQGLRMSEDFRLNDCALTSDTFNFCTDYKIRRFSNFPVNRKMAVLQNGTFKNHHDLKWIELSKYGIEIVESGSFGCARSLESLDLSENNIEELPYDIFSCLTNLISLNLSNNRIKVLPKCLRSLASLQHLYFSINFIATFPETGLHDEARLTRLDLSMNKIETFCPSELIQIESLCWLELRGNNIRNFRDECFAKLSNLFYLHIGMNADLFLTNDSFTGLDRLERLFIDGSGLEIAFEESGIFSKNPLLYDLRLQRNRLKEVHFDLFRQLRELKYLFLSFNAISVLQNKCFENNLNLEYLDLSNNNLVELKSGHLLGPSNLRHLYVSYNRIRNVDEDAFDHMKRLRTLNISNNVMSPIMTSSSPMHAFHNIFPKLRYLKVLDMSNSTTSDFEFVFERNNKFLTHLDVSRNMGVHLSRRSLANLPNLRILRLENTNIESFSLLFDNNKQYKLEEINISGNNIRKVDDDFLKRVKNLKFLDLSRNNITEINSTAFSCCDKLEYLNISHNRLQSTFGLDDYPFFRTKRFLKVLDVSSNNLYDIEWLHISFVTNVWISDNNINHLPLSEIVDYDIQSLHIENNKIRRLPLDFNLQNEDINSGKRTRIYMDKNPVDCDCNALWLYQYVINKSADGRLSFKGLECRGPAEIGGRALESLSPFDFTCDVTESCPDKCRCLKRACDGVTVTNCSQRDLNRLPEVAPANTTILDVTDNRISSFDSLNSSIWKYLTEIYAERNNVSSAELYIPENVQVFLLRGNRLTELPESLQKHADSIRAGLVITLSDNPWSCGCESLPLKYFLSRRSVQILDAFEVRCVNSGNLTLVERKDQELCPAGQKGRLFFAVGVIATLSVLVLVLSVWLCYNKNKHFIHTVIITYCRRLYDVLSCQELVEENKIFDCFISYGSEDVEVPLAIVRELGEEPNPEFQFCVHDRHWKGGSYISENIFRSVENSRKTLIVVSKTFVKNKWFHLEFQAALMQMLKDRRDRIIFVVKGDLPDYEDLPRDVRHFFRTRTYLVWGERWFFEKLRYSLQEESVPLGEQLRDFLLKVNKCLRDGRIYLPDVPEEESGRSDLSE